MTGIPAAALAWIAIVLIVSFAALRAWRGWLELKRLEIASRTSDARPTDPEPGLRIELASVKERLRRLEAIANGVEL